MKIDFWKIEIWKLIFEKLKNLKFEIWKLKIENLWKIYENGACACDSDNGYIDSGDQCVNSSLINTHLLSVTKEDEEKIEYNASTENILRKTSDYISNHFYHAIFGCLEYKDIQSCSLFANLCVMHLYNANRSLCSIYKSN